MRDVDREMRAARSLRRWLRRAALSAIPVAGLAGCGKDCGPDYDLAQAVDGGISASVGSVLSPSQCAPYCVIALGDGTCIRDDLTSCRVASATSVSCHYDRVICVPSPCGRLPAGLRERSVTRPCSPIATRLAQAAYLEGAAVFAFRALARELNAHGAPAELIERAKNAERDEVRHHASMSALAARFSAETPTAEVEPLEVRTLLELALENAVEGCVRETWGAVVAIFQGEQAKDAAVRRAMRSIAVDETEHAALGWSIDAWVCRRLRPSERIQVERARAEARNRLLAQVFQSVPDEVDTILGLPGAAPTKRMARALEPLWAQWRTPGEGLAAVCTVQTNVY
jgi:hypothetical protein